MNNYLRAKQVPETKIHYSLLEFFILFIYGFGFILIIYNSAYKEQYWLSISIAIFISFLFYYRYLYRYNKLLDNSQHWIPVQAKVVNKKLMTHIVISDRRGGFLPSIKYNYEIDGTFYSSIQFSLFPTIILLKKKEEAKKLMYALTKSKEITVYVDPLNYNNSFIYNGDHNKVYNAYLPFLILIVLFPLFGPILYFYLA